MAEDPTAEHAADANELTTRLHEAGWADHVTVEPLLRDWDQLVDEVADYRLTIDDYTNDVTSRDALELVMEWSSPGFATVLAARVAAADDRFRAATTDDGGAAISSHFRIDLRAGWWWRRRPDTGPLADYLDAAR